MKNKDGLRVAGLVSGLIQICIVTENYEAAVETLAGSLGIGPWKCWDYSPPAILDTWRHGNPAGWTLKLGVAWIGAVQLEVIQPGRGETTYREFLDRQGEGIHHLLLETKTDYLSAGRALVAAGYPALQSARINPPMQIGSLTLPPLPGFLANKFATQFVYHDTQATLGTVAELSRMPPGIPFRLGVRLGKPDFWIPAGSTDVEASLENRLVEQVTRIGIAVQDPEGTAKRWEALGVGPWEPAGHAPFVSATAALPPVTVDLVRLEGPFAGHQEGVCYLGVRLAGGGLQKIQSLGCEVLGTFRGGVLVDARTLAKTGLFVE